MVRLAIAIAATLAVLSPAAAAFDATMRSPAEQAAYQRMASLHPPADPFGSKAKARHSRPHRSLDAHRRRSVQDVRYLPNPPGTWRVALSCAHRLAAYWGLGKGLDKVSTWKRVFARASGPGVGIAAVRRGEHHVMGIIGGGPGAWRVADFNSGGHLNREYTVANFSGFFFLDTRTRIAAR